MQWPTQGANPGRDSGIKIGKRGSGDARGEGGRVKFMFGVEDKGGIKSPDAQVVRWFAKEQVQEMTCHRGVAGGGFDALAGLVELMPIEQHGGKGGEQPIGHMLLVPAGCFRFEAT